MKIIKSTHGALTECKTLEFEGTTEEYQEVKHLFEEEPKFDTSSPFDNREFKPGKHVCGVNVSDVKPNNEAIILLKGLRNGTINAIHYIEHDTEYVIDNIKNGFKYNICDDMLIADNRKTSSISWVYLDAIDYNKTLKTD